MASEASASAVASVSRKRQRISHASSSSDISIEQRLDKAKTKQLSGQKAYWEHVTAVIAEKDGIRDVFYECLICSKYLSSKNPHDFVANHIVCGSGGEATCNSKRKEN